MHTGDHIGCYGHNFLLVMAITFFLEQLGDLAESDISLNKLVKSYSQSTIWYAIGSYKVSQKHEPKAPL